MGYVLENEMLYRHGKLENRITSLTLGTIDSYFI